jgi:hypothetical protein
MAKGTPEAQPATPPPPDKKKDKAGKKKVEVPPMVDLTITFARAAFLLVSVMVALISYGAGCDWQTIFVRTMVSMISTGMILWLVSWWVTQKVIENYYSDVKAKQANHLHDEGLLKDVKA